MKPLSVSDLSQYITQIFDYEELLHNIKVYGEVSGFNIVRGNAYFTVKDEGAILSCIIFGCEGRFGGIKDGDQVLLDGSIRYYSKGGKVNFYATNISPYGQGILYQKYIELKARLENEGLFDPSHKRQIPGNVTKVGVITSKTGAVIRDIQSVISRRNPLIDIYLYPAKVQGEGADKTVIDGLDYFDNSDVDVVIIARGGGSIEDLWPFNSEALARRVYQNKKPVVSAVGHETDFTIVDFVADLRAPTPSVAGELVSNDIIGSKSNIMGYLSRMILAMDSIATGCSESVSYMFDKLAQNMSSKIDKCHSKLMLQSNKLISIYPNIYREHENHIQNSLNILSSLNPAALLKRGYAVVSKNGERITSVSSVTVGDNIKIEYADGEVNAEVKIIKEKK